MLKGNSLFSYISFITLVGVLATTTLGGTSLVTTKLQVLML